MADASSHCGPVGCRFLGDHHAVLALLAGALLLPAADVTGKRSGSFEITGPSGETRDIGIYFDFKHTGSELKGFGGENESRNWEILDGKVDGDKISFEVKQSPDHPGIRFQLVYANERIQGDASAEMDGNKMSGKVNVTRKTG